MIPVSFVDVNFTIPFAFLIIGIITVYAHPSPHFIIRIVVPFAWIGNSSIIIGAEVVVWIIPNPSG